MSPGWLLCHPASILPALPDAFWSLFPRDLLKPMPESVTALLRNRSSVTDIENKLMVTGWEIGEGIKSGYWGWHIHKIIADGDCSHEIKRHLLLGRKALTNLDNIWKSRDITLPTKVHLVKAMVFPGVMYACEIWTRKKTEHWRIDAFELCFCTRIADSLVGFPGGLPWWLRQ